MQRLLADVGFVRLDVEGVLPRVIELEVVQRRLVGQIEHLFEDDHAQRSGHRLVGPAVVFTEEGSERFFVGDEQRQRLTSKAACPVFLLQAGDLLRRKQNVERTKCRLGIRASKHA